SVGETSGDDATETGALDPTSGTPSDTEQGADSSGTESSDDQASPPPLPYARDIRIPRLTANQGVQVTLVDNGVEIAGEDYNTRIITGRRTLIRGFWSLRADFEPRTLIGRLTLDYEDGTQINQDYEVMVTGDSGDGGASFQWLLEPDQVVPGIRFRARVLEVDEDQGGGVVADPPPITPLAGRGELSVYDVPLQMRVILVPVQHEFEGCTMTPEPTDDDVDVMRQQLEQSNPIQEAIVELGEPMLYTEAIGTAGEAFSGVLGALVAHRATIQPADNVYLYGLLDPCDGFPPGLLGQAIGIPGEPLPELAAQRISTGRWRGSGLATSETFVHEVGHTQGRRHVFCSGGEAGIDSAYPHEGGRIGVWGFGIHDFILRTPTGARDYMTYCSNEWVSDYAWEQTLEVIEQLTSWDTQRPPAAPQGELLIGSVLPDGRTRWWTSRGDLDPTRLPSPHQLHLSIDGTSVAVATTTQPQPDGPGTTVIARLPESWTRATSMRLSGPGLAMTIAPSTVRRSAR
ncbi:MAG: hypothetical protein JKY37_13045, partial [Nannocystaceae bacterium]|nr:hypothetical protein [Nannocystaceae bacterium]